jgi:undecaprenyl-diphosphatase
MFSLIQSVDTLIRNQMTLLSNSECMLVAKFITAITYGGVAWWLVAILAWRQGYRGIILQMAVAMVVGGIEIAVFKHFFHRERPMAVTLYEFWMPIHGLFADRYSFPSGHSLLSFAAAGVFMYRFKDWRRWLSFSLACLVGFCRIYEGVHWTSDVVAGALLGLLAAWIAICLTNALNKRRNQAHLPDRSEKDAL